MAIIAAFPGCDSQPKASFKSTDITGAEFARDFTLTDHHGAKRRLVDFKGKVVVIFFGFTHCPDVCPTTLAEMAKAMKQIGPDAAERVQVLFVTVDPERDKPAVLKNYVTAFHPSFLGLWGDEEALNRTKSEFKMVAVKNGETSPGNYTVDHSTQSFVYDAQNRVRLYVPNAKIGEALAHDIGMLLQ